MTNAKQVYEWVKTGHWNRRQFLEWAQPVPPRTWVGSGDLEDSNAYLTPPQRTERHELQAKGEHPAPCARHCEANAFQIVIKNLKAQLAQPEQEPVAWIEKDMQCDDFDPDSVTCEKPTIVADGWEWVPLYTSPPQRTWVGLTLEQIQHRIDTHIGVPSPKYPLDNSDFINFALVIADELKGKNT